MREIRCINCMKPIDENMDSCPHCGYGQREGQSPFSMKPNTILRGRYLVGRVLGQGGFGITYVGYDLTLDVKVAIKEYFPMGLTVRNSTVSNQLQYNTTQVSNDQWEQGCDSFLKEARRMAQVDSLPGIVRVRDTFPENRTAYIVMDYIEGENLKQVLMKQGVMSLTQCITMLQPLMESLGVMHQKGLIHRDISPDNIMVQPDGSACLLDFGATKDVSLRQNAASRQVAKKGFSSPEQYREKGNIGSWTDVYALCATIYYCVTGKMIPDAMDRMYEDTLTFDVPMQEPLDKAAVNVLKDGLRLNSVERIQTVEELLQRLKKLVQPITPESSKPFPKKKIAILSAAAVCVFLLMIVGINHKKGQDTDLTAPAASVIDSEEDTETYVNTLMKDSTGDWLNDDLFQGTVLGSEISRESIISVTFTDTLADMPDTAWDVSWNQDGTVMAWTEQDTDSGEYYKLYIGANGGVKGKNCYRLFTGYYNVETIDFNDSFDTSEVTDMAAMFDDCEKLTELDVRNFDTGNVTDMRWMFYDCKGLSALDVGNFETGKVTKMQSMFKGCEKLTELNVSGFDTSGVTDMSYMFKDCFNLEILDVSGFDTGRVTDMCAMFEQCESLTELDVSGFVTGNVTDMCWMFNGCKNLTALDVSGFDTGAVTTMKRMFNECSNLKELDVSSFDTSKVTDVSYMFYNCKKLAGLDADNFSISAETDVTDMFSGCSFTAKEAGINLNKNKLMKDASVEWGDDGICRGTVLGSEISRDSIATVTCLDTLSTMPDTAWDISLEQDGTVMAWTEKSEADEDLLDLFIAAEGCIKGTDCGYLFSGYYNAERINFNDCFDTSQATSMYAMFASCENLSELDVSNFDTDNVTDMGTMFYGCKNLAELDVSNFETGNVTNMYSMFYKCESLTELDVSGFDTKNATDMSHMFRKCPNLTELDVRNFDTGNVTNMSYMFNECRSLTELDVSNFDTDKVIDMNCIFAGCEKLTEVNVSNFETGNVTNMSSMFYGCENLAELDVSNFETGNVTNMYSMFYKCESLTELDVSSFNTGNVTDMSHMFNECQGLRKLNVSNFETGNVTNMYSMFCKCESLTELDVSSFDTGNVTDMSNMFRECPNLTELDVSNFETGNVTNMEGMFYDCGITAEEAGLK